MALDPLTALLDVGGKVLDRVLPDPAARDAAKLALLELAQKGELAIYTAQADIVRAEVASTGWLASSWRPLLMLTFGALIVARWFGWAAPNLTEAEYIELWDIVQLGLGGYVFLRTAEKVTPSIVDAIKR